MPFVLIGVVVVALLASAVMAQGFPVRQLDLDDTGIWVSNDAAGEFGRFNKAAIGLDARLSSPGERISPFELDILQDANAVFGLDDRAGRLTRIDTATGKPVTEQSVGIEPGASVQLRGGTIAVMDRRGRLWAARYDPSSGIADLGALDATLKPLAELGLAADVPAGAAAMAVSTSGTVYLAAADGRLITLAATPGGLAAPALISGRPSLTSIALTVVGEQPVALDAGSGTVVLGSGHTTQVAADPQARLQQPGAASSVVLLALAQGLARIDLGSGQVTMIDSVGGGTPAEPVQLAGCDFAAWAGVGRVVRACGNADPNLTQVANGLERPTFRMNRGLIVLNDQADGLIYDLELQASVDWPKPETITNDRPQKEDNKEPSQSQPKAVDDDLFARPDRTTALYLLDNDTNTVAGVLAIRQVSKPSPEQGVTLRISPDAQTVLIHFPSGVGAVRFTYTISDGSTTSQGTVVVHDAGDREAAPTLRPHYVPAPYAVAAFGNVSIPITSEWRDPEGDPVTLLRAFDADHNPIPVTPAGQIDYSPGEADADGKRVLSYDVTDGLAEPVTKTVSVQVLGKDSFTEIAPIARPDVIRGEVGKPLVFSPLGNDLPGADPRNLAARLTLAGEIPDQANLSVTADEKTGQVTVVAKREGPYSLTYTVGYGSAAQATGQIRIDALRAEGQDPVAMPDQAAMRGRTPVLVDVVANDYDPAGNVLSVVAVNPADAEQVQVQVVDGRWLRVLPQGDHLIPNPQVIHYTVSNGSQTAVGDVLVTQLDNADADRILARKDAAVVRVGDSVSVSPMANDLSVSGQRLHLATDTLGTDNDGRLAVYEPSKRGDADPSDVGQAYVHGDQIRYVPPASVTGSRQVRIPYTVVNVDGDTAQSEVVVTIKAEPDQANPDHAPAASAVEARVTSGSRIQIPIPTSGQDPDGDSVVVTGIASAPALGRVVGYGPSSITYEAFPTDGLVGTDSFTYVVADRYGRTGTGSVRISVTAPGQTQPPVAIDDQLTAGPGADVRINALGNDYYSRDDVVRIAALEKLNDPLPAGAKTVSEVGPVLLKAPGDGDQPVLLNYALVGNGGTGPAATIKVTSRAGYNNPPTVVDQIAEATGKLGTVDLLTKAWDVDGEQDQLRVEPLIDVEGATLTGSRYTVPLLDHPQVIPYRVSDAAGGMSAAVVYVPAIGAGAPHLKVDGSIELASNATATFGIEDYVESPRGRVVRIASPHASAAPSADLDVRVDDAGRFTLTSKNGYVGPASVTLTAMDAESLTEDGVLSAVVSIPVQVGDRTPVLRCPTDPQTVVQGGEAKTLDITTLCHVWGPDAGSLASLSYTADWATPIAGVDAAASGRRVQVQAGGGSVGGASGVLTIGIAGTAAKPAKLPITVIAAPRPKLRSVRFTDIKANTAVTVPLSLSSPLVDARPQILSVEQISGAAATLTHTDTAVTITPALDTSGLLQFRVLATDLAGSPDRTDRQASGAITLVVYARPDPPSAPQSGSTVESHAATLSWQPGSANGAAIDLYSLRIASGPGAGTETECRSTGCRFVGLTNGEAVTFEVKARNRAGWSDWSKPSKPITPNTAPGSAASVSTSDPKDGSLLVSWGAISNDGSRLTNIYITYGGATIDAGASATSRRITGLDNNQTYTFTVTAKNAAGVGPSASAKGQSSGRPLGLSVGAPVPQDLVGATTQTAISWSLGSANGPTPVTYDVQRSDGKRICSNVSTRSCTDDSVVFDGTSYTYAVTATNATGGSEHSAQDTSPSWRATGTPDAWAGWTATPTGTDGQATLSYTVPPARGSSSTVSVLSGGSVLKTLGNQTGGPRTETLTGLTDGTAYSLRLRVCNEADRCSTSSPISVTTFGPLANPTVSASHSDATVSASASGNGNGASATLRLYIDGTLVDERSGTGAISVSGSRVVGYSHTANIRAELSDSGRGTHTATTSETTGAEPPPPRTVAVSEGTWITSSTCTSGCRYVVITLSGFSGSTTCQVSMEDSSGVTHTNWRSYTFTSNGSHQTGAYLGYWGHPVWAVCDGVASPQKNWSKT